MFVSRPYRLEFVAVRETVFSLRPDCDVVRDPVRYRLPAEELRARLAEFGGASAVRRDAEVEFELRAEEEESGRAVRE